MDVGGLAAAFDVQSFGAVGDGMTTNTDAIQRSIEHITGNGGGTLYFPPGDYLTGTLRMRDNVTLYLETGCTIWGSTDLGDYDPDHKHLLYAKNARNIVLDGRGAIDGNGPRFWDNGRLAQWLRGEIELPRTSDMIRFDHCENITIENIEVRNGAFWNIGFGNCQRITARALTIINGIYDEDGPNTDGINLWDCTRIRISDCDIQTGDDCIVVLGDSRDVNITNCKFTTTETALMISGVRNLTFSNCTIHDAGCGIGFRVWNGIVVDGVRIDNIVMDVSDKFDTGGQVIYMWSFPLYIESETEIPKGKPLPPAGTVDNVTISNVTAKANGGVFVTGFRESGGYIKGLTLDNVKIHMFGGKDKSELNANPPDPYPIYGFHGAPYSMYFRYINRLQLRNVEFTWNTPEQTDWGSVLRCESVNDLEVSGFNGRQSLGSEAPAIRLKKVASALVRNSRAPENTGTFIEIGSGVAKIALLGNDLGEARKTYSIAKGVSPNLFETGNRLPKDDPD